MAKRRRKKRAPVWLIAAGAAVGVGSLIWGILTWPGYAAVLRLAAGVLFLLPLLYFKKRPLKKVRPLLVGGGAVLVLSLLFQLAFINVGWTLLPADAQALDLSGQGLARVNDLAKIRELRTLDLSGNRVASTEPLSRLYFLEYLDLTDNDLPQEEYDRLRSALPRCVILCEARDESLTELDLSGRTLPGMEKLSQVLSARPSLARVDLTGVNLTAGEIDALCRRFEGIDFSYVIAADGGALRESTPAIALKADSFDGVTARLGSFTSLQRVDIQGCVLTADEVIALRQRYPAVTFDCAVSLYGVTARTGDEALILDGCGAGTELGGQLGAFYNLRRISLRGLRLDAVASVRSCRPDAEITFDYDGMEIGPGTTSLSFHESGVLPANDLPQILYCAPSITRVELPQVRVSTRLINLMDACPDTTFVLDLFGQSVATDAQTLDFGSVRLTDDQAGELALALTRMPEMREVDLYESRLSRESMDRLFDQFPEVFFGFTASGQGFTVRSDITAFSTLKTSINPRYTWEDMSFLRYCKNLRALDLGHNALTDLSFLLNFPKLEVLILADNDITDISPLARLPELTYVELFMNEITDVSPLADHPRLIDLNLCYNNLGGKPAGQLVEPILSCGALERCWISNNALTSEQKKALTDGLPTCQFEFTVKESTGSGWRRHDRYKILKEMMTSRTYIPFS